jgi:hypothetical protein
MAQTLTSKLRILASWDFSDDGAGGGTTKNASSLDLSLSLGSGTGAGSNNKILARLNGFTITAGSSVDVDLAGVVADFVGASITMTKVKVIAVKLAEATNQASSILIGSKGTNGFATWLGGTNHAVRVRKGGGFGIGCTDATGYAVTAGTGDLMTLTNEDTANAATYQLIVAGVS